MVYIIILSMIVGALGFYYYFLKDMNYFKKNRLPYVTPLPIFGNKAGIIFHRESMVEFINRFYNLHPDAKYVGMYDMNNKPVTVLRDLELIRMIAVKYFDRFPEHRPVVDHQDPIMDKALFFLRGEKWKEIRTLVSPAFSSTKLNNMFELISEYSVDFANFLRELPPEKKMMEMKDVFTRFTNDIIATCAFGVSVDSMRKPKNQFYMYGREITTFGFFQFLKIYIFRILPWLIQILKIRIVSLRVEHFFKDLIENVIKTRDEKGIVRLDMLQLMMENRGKEGKPVSIDDMVSQAYMFFFGGFETTSTLMNFAAYEIAINQNVRERLQKEIDEVLEDTKGRLSSKVINNMEYLNAVIHEALRMYPVVEVIDRLCIKDLELPPTLPGVKPFTIKKGQIVLIPIYGIHHDPKYFKEPEKFDPERFIGERKKHSLNCGAFLPFGLGPRMCIAYRFALLEIKLLFFHLLARCDLNPCKKTLIPLKIAKQEYIKIEGGVWLSIVPRKNPHPIIADNIINKAQKT